MTTREEIVAEARTWIGAPLFHKGRSREGGVDCLGLLIGVAEAVGATRGEIVVPDYGRLPNADVLMAAMDAQMIALVKGEVGSGDVGGFSWGRADAPMHLAIFAEHGGRRTIIHADPASRCVVEVGFGGYHAANYCAAWRFPNLVV